MGEYARYVGFDQHKEWISIAVAAAGREAEEYLGSIRNKEEDIERWFHHLSREWGGLKDVLVCYEAGPGGYTLQRQLQGMGIACEVVAPSLIPRRPGERRKTDRRDAQKLARLSRGGELTAIWVPDERHEALRDLLRGREAAVEDVLRHQHQLSTLLQRQGKHAPEGVKAWSYPWERWLEALRWEWPIHQELMAEMRQAIMTAQQRVERLEELLAEAVALSPWAATVAGLECFRGVQLVVAATLVAEIGVVGRFAHPADLMGYAGLVPSENSSGERIHRGDTGPGGNHHLRRVLIEAAWAYVHPPRVGEKLARRHRGQPAEVIDIAWRAQVRLCKRYRQLMARGKQRNEVITAVARELCGFLWEALQVLPLPEAA